MQMERLPCVLRIHGGPVASETIPGGAIAPMKCLRGLLDTAIDLGTKGKRWEGPQTRELARRLKKGAVSVVVANYGPTGVALSQVCKAIGIPLVVHFHGYDAHMTSVIHEYRERYRQLGEDAAAIIAVSHRMVTALTSYGFPADKIRLVRCGADSSQFSEKANFSATPLFLGVGRFVDKKAPYLTLLAFQEVQRIKTDAKLVLCGDGPLFESTRNLAAAMGLDEAVTFPGPVSPASVATWMQSATAFVQHSLTPRYGPSAGDSEGTPVAVLEAMMTGLPVISTRHAGIGEVIDDGETGLLIEERDTGAMAQAMLSLCNDPALAKRIGSASRAKALLHYSEQSYIHSLQQIITSL
jgi:colanic acid/amylovoran biosynthesis glycosyltransferase